MASSSQLIDLIQSGAGLTASNDSNLSTSSITGLIAQSLAPVLTPFTDGLAVMTSKLEPLPLLQQLTIDAITQASDNVVDAVDRVAERLDRVERVNTKMLTELQAIEKAA